VALEALNALVVGVSADKPEVQQRFIDKFDLTFPMVPDTGKLVIAAYGARGVLGVTAQRSTFLIAPDGKIARVWPKVKLEGHAKDVVDAIRQLSQEVYTP
jgi:peroxiredoxin Q/BCP